MQQVYSNKLFQSPQPRFSPKLVAASLPMQMSDCHLFIQKMKSIPHELVPRENIHSLYEIYI